MAIQCANDGQYLVPGKRVVLKRFQGLASSPIAVVVQHNYWRLVNTKGVLVDGAICELNTEQLVLVQFDLDFAELGLASQVPERGLNTLWVALCDLKFVCRY